MGKGGRWAPPFLVCLALVAAGCGAGEDEGVMDTEASAVKFEGSPDSALAGVYKTKDGLSTYTFKPDGAEIADIDEQDRGHGA